MQNMQEEELFQEAQTPEDYVREEMSTHPLRCYTSRGCATEGCTYNNTVRQCVPTEVDKEIGRFGWRLGPKAKEYFRSLPQHIADNDVLDDYCSYQTYMTCYRPCRVGLLDRCRLGFEVAFFMKIIVTAPPDASVFARVPETIDKQLNFKEETLVTGQRVSMIIAPIVKVCGSILQNTRITSVVVDSMSHAHKTAEHIMAMMVNGSLNTGSHVVQALEDIFVHDQDMGAASQIIDMVIGAPVKEELVLGALPLAIESLINRITDALHFDADTTQNIKKMNGIICCLSSSMLFGYVHSFDYTDPLSPMSIYQVTHCFASGLVYYVAARKYGVQASMFMHAFGNTVAKYAAEIDRAIEEGSRDVPNDATIPPEMVDSMFEKDDAEDKRKDDEFFDAMAEDVFADGA